MQTKNLKVDPKTFQKIIVWNYFVTSYFRCCPANATFLLLRWTIFNKMINPGNEKSQITYNWNKKNLTTSKNLSESLSLSLLCDVIFSFLSGKSYKKNILCFTMSIFHLHDYHWQPNFSNHMKLKLKRLTRSK